MNAPGKVLYYQQSPPGQACNDRVLRGDIYLPAIFILEFLWQDYLSTAPC